MPKKYIYSTNNTPSDFKKLSGQFRQYKKNNELCLLRMSETGGAQNIDRPFYHKNQDIGVIQNNVSQ